MQPWQAKQTKRTARKEKTNYKLTLTLKESKGCTRLTMCANKFKFLVSNIYLSLSLFFFSMFRKDNIKKGIVYYLDGENRKGM